MRTLHGIAALVALGLTSCAVELPPESPPPGALVITEVAAEPDDSRPQWIELLNAGDEAVILSNCFLRTEEGDNPIFLDLTAEPGARLVLADQADLGTEPGELRADAVLQDLVLRHSGADEVLELWCAEAESRSTLIASATYNWNEELIRKGRSRQLVESSEEEAWCEAPTMDAAIYFDENVETGKDGEFVRVVEYGTPFAPAICDVPAGDTPTERGQVLFSEIVIDNPDGDAMPEWFELLASPANTGTLDLRGCQILEAPHLGGDGTVRRHVLDPELGTTGIAPGERLLLADNSVVNTRTDGALVIDGSVPVDYFFSTLTFSNSSLRSLTLICPGPEGPLEIDSISFDWGPYDGDFDGYSLELHDGAVPSDRFDASANDRPSAWCPAEDLFAEGSYSWTEMVGDLEVLHEGSFSYYGTPGAPNGDCPVPDPWPGVGDLVFTEIMGNPAGSDASEEWFEIWNPGTARYELDGCRVENNNFDSGVEDDWGIDSSLVIDGGDYAVMATSPNGDFWACVDEPAAHFTGFSFNNSDFEELQLICPDGIGGEVVVDRVTYDSNFESGISLQVPAALATAGDNDDTTLWCSLPVGDPDYTFACLDVETSETSYGTPGEASNCP